MKAIACTFAMLALAGCAETKAAPPPMVRDRACNVIEPYRGDVGKIKPNEAREWAAGTNAGLYRLCAQH